MTQTTQNSRTIKATPERIYQAFSNPRALEVWLAPGEMTGQIHDFDFTTGGGYRMSLFYPETENEFKGKTAEREDRFNAQFIELIPNQKIVQIVNFESADPDFTGDMTMEVTLAAEEDGTKVTFSFMAIPKGIKPEDNEAGTELTLEKLARYVESESGEKEQAS